jgi:hypothetical protein
MLPAHPLGPQGKLIKTITSIDFHAIEHQTAYLRFGRDRTKC